MSLITDEKQDKIPPFDVDQAAHALARKFNWKIYPNGISVLNKLGLSEFAALTSPAMEKDFYFTNGPSKKYNIGNQRLEFKHIPEKDSVLEYENTAMVILAIRAVTKNHITTGFIKKIKEKFTTLEWGKIKSYAIHSTGWVYKVICDINDR